MNSVEENLKETNIPPKYLEIEITESTFMKNEQQVLNTLDKLRELGVSIALDDFGKGYSSLSYLLDLEFNTLKIDQYFIQKLASDDEKNDTIVSSVIELGKKLNLKVIAEGVEENKQMEFLRQRECDIVQGYLYSRPVPKKDFEQMLMVGYLKPQRKKHQTNQLWNEGRIFVLNLSILY